MQAHLSVHFLAFVSQTVKCRLLVLTLPVLRYIMTMKPQSIITLAPSGDAGPTPAVAALTSSFIEKDSLADGDRLLNCKGTI